MKDAKAEPKVVIEATIIRADGRREPLGVIAETNKGNVVFNMLKKLGGN